MVSSVVCRYEHWSEPWFKKWAAQLGLPADPTGTDIQRKGWKFCVIGRALEERGALEPSKKGLCFAAGREPLPGAFARLGCDILATDLATEGDWKGQHAAQRDDLFHENIVSRDEFDRRVSFRHVDMRDIKGVEPEAFDFLWSSCAFEHLGSLQAGLDFVVNAMKYLRPGGVAVHTTEFNLTSNDKTIDSGGFVIYRKCDIEALDRHLRSNRCGLEPVDFYGGSHQFDLDYDTEPYFKNGKPHVKLQLGSFVSTSILLVIHKA